MEKEAYRRLIHDLKIGFKGIVKDMIPECVRDDVYQSKKILHHKILIDKLIDDFNEK